MHPKVMIGLGNPGTQYQSTRHNAGFLFVDALQEMWDFPQFTENKKLSSFITSGMVDGEKIILAKPTTFMNASGKSVRAVSDFYRIAPEGIVIAHDELDLPLGKYKISTDRGPAGHNGVSDIIAHLQTQNFTRIRIGIDARDDIQKKKMRGSDYVLGAFSTQERKELLDVFREIIDRRAQKENAPCSASS